jgi:hypothetical protein
MTTKTNTFGLSYAREIYVKILGENIKVNDEGNRLKTLLDDLGWEYQRMSRSGKEVYDEIQQLLGGLPENETWMEID